MRCILIGGSFLVGMLFQQGAEGNNLGWPEYGHLGSTLMGGFVTAGAVAFVILVWTFLDKAFNDIEY